MTEKEAIKIINEEKSWESDDRKIDAFIIAIDSLEEVQKYREIGTPEECRDMVDKQRKKKILNPLTSFSLGTCPVCSIHQLGRWRYCSNCGQKLDWGDE